MEYIQAVDVCCHYARDYGSSLCATKVARARFVTCGVSGLSGR